MLVKINKIEYKAKSPGLGLVSKKIKIKKGKKVQSKTEAVQVGEKKLKL